MSVRLPEPAVPPLWLLDANVLFSEWSRQFCGVLAKQAGARLFYTPLIEEEAFRNLRRLNRLSEVDAIAQRAALLRWLPAELYTVDASAYLDDVRFVETKDRPIAASALARYHTTEEYVGLLTWNVKDFPRKQLLRKGVVRYTPDELAVRLSAELHLNLKDLLLEAKACVIRFSKSCPVQEPTSFQQRAQPWPETNDEWVQFLRRNRLMLLAKRVATSGLFEYPPKNATHPE